MTTTTTRPPILTGDEIRRRREALDISQQELAYGAEVTQGYLSHLENGWQARSNRRRHALKRVAAELERLERRAARETERNGDAA
jgi:predicted transcriptional regulator